MAQRELVEQARQGDLDAFSDLAAAAITRLYAVATLILRDTERAQDAVQDALVLAWQDIHALRDADAWEAWLHRLTVRACVKHARKERRRIAVEVRQELDADAIGVPDLSASVVERDRLEREIGKLPIEQRAVMVVHYYLDQPLSAAAEILDIPVGTAKSRLHHGLVALRRSMGRDPGSPPAVTATEPTA
jgi:RNA polymerase sigma-70 factor (ECF subfamily)